LFKVGMNRGYVVLVYHHFRLFELYTAHPLIGNRYF
jgi:hypothetical protein